MQTVTASAASSNTLSDRLGVARASSQPRTARRKPGRAPPLISWRIPLPFSPLRRLVLVHLFAAASLVLCDSVAFAVPSTFQLTSVYSTLDGSDQFIRLAETAGVNVQNHVAGLTLTTTHGGVTKTFTFPRDLPTEKTAHASLVLNVGYAYIFLDDGSLIPLGAEWAIAPRFLATDAGTVGFADADVVSYAALPTDGEHGLLRDAQLRAISYRLDSAGSAAATATYLLGQLP